MCARLGRGIGGGGAPFKPFAVAGPEWGPCAENEPLVAGVTGVAGPGTMNFPGIGVNGVIGFIGGKEGALIAGLREFPASGCAAAAAVVLGVG